MTYVKYLKAHQRKQKDILQDSFIKIWKNLRSFDKNLKLENWIFRIVHNEAISFYRQNLPLEKIKPLR
ncbi:MAG: hypothetical protein IPG79_18520 [Saprospiraceae bacterium]|nr:hypothetical protein [Saprospiraceae bacterium]